MKKRILTLTLLGVMLSTALIGCTSQKRAKNNPFLQSVMSESKQEEPTEEPQEDKEITVGESFVSDKLQITFVDCSLDYIVEDDEWGFYDLEDGQKYISTTFTFENIGDDSEYVSIYDFSCYADNASMSQAYIGDDNFMNENLSAGRNVTFTTYYIVPRDAESIELEYTPMFGKDDHIIKVQ